MADLTQEEIAVAENIGARVAAEIINAYRTVRPSDIVAVAELAAERDELKATLDRIHDLAVLWRSSGAAQLLHVADVIEDTLRGDPSEEADRHAS